MHLFALHKCDNFGLVGQMASPEKSIIVELKDDPMPEPSKAFALTISRTTGGLAKPTAYLDPKVVIFDDDMVTPSGYLVPTSILYRSMELMESLTIERSLDVPVSYLRLGGKTAKQALHYTMARLFEVIIEYLEKVRITQPKCSPVQAAPMRWADGELGTKHINYQVIKDYSFEVYARTTRVPANTYFYNPVTPVRATSSWKILAFRYRYY